MQVIEVPTHCPACNSVLELVKDELYCRNADCPAQSTKKVEAFCKALRIKGFGPAAIERLGLNSIPQLVAIQDNDFMEAGFSDLMADKLAAEISQAVKRASLAELLAGFSIPLIGKTAATKIAANVPHISEIDEAACKAAGIGPKATENLLSWLDANYTNGEFASLPFSFQSNTYNKEKSVSGETVCISGKLVSYPTKAKAKTALENAGHVVKDSVTKEVTVLINESGIASAKTAKAQKLGITVVTSFDTLLEI